MKRDYVKIEPSRGILAPETVVRYIAGLRKLGDSGMLNKLMGSAETPTFEFIIYSSGADEQIEFYVGCNPDEMLDQLARKLRSMYPDSFDYREVEFDLATALIPRLDEFDYDPDEYDEQTLYAIEGNEPESGDDNLPTTLKDPEEIRPDLDEIDPIVTRWGGVGHKSKDWMTPLRRFTQREQVEDEEAPPRSPLSDIIEEMAHTDFPIAYQVLFERRPDWSGAASKRKNDIRLGQDGFRAAMSQTFNDAIFGMSTEEKRERYKSDTATEVGEGSQQSETAVTGDLAGRKTLIDLKSPGQTFTVNVRAAAVPRRDYPIDIIEPTMKSICSAFDHLDGYFYSIQGDVLKGSWKDKAVQWVRRGETRLEIEFQRMLDREIVTSKAGKKRRHLVLNADELANLISVPSSRTLTVAGERGARGKAEARDPLPRPDPDVMEAFEEPGMAIGYAMDEDGKVVNPPVQLGPRHLERHYLRAASTGSGKSVAVQNDLLTAHANISGPTVLVDPKGDGMCMEYLRAHYKQYNTLDNVFYFRVPDVLPAFSFFDIRPAMKSGRRREDAIEDKINHFHEILRMVMDSDLYEQAFVANEILDWLIKALFDKKHGSDAFGIDDLSEAVRTMLKEQKTPPISEENRDVEDELSAHFEKDAQQFTQSMEAARHRINQIKKNAHLYKIFSHVPEWDDEKQRYASNVFDFRHFLEEDVVLLFDTGDLRPEAQQAFTLLLLSNVWDAVQVRRRDPQAEYDYVTNLILEEAADIASSELVYKQLLPQGRSFGLAMGLIMQFSEQVDLGDGGDRAYREILNNVKTKLVGNVEIDSDLAEALAHEDLEPVELRNRLTALPTGEWIAQLPSPGFGKTAPELFTVKPLPIPLGTTESDELLHPDQASTFKSSALPRIETRTATHYGIDAPVRDDDEGMGDDDSVFWGVDDGSEEVAEAQADEVGSSILAAKPTRRSSGAATEETTADISEATPQQTVDATEEPADSAGGGDFLDEIDAEMGLVPGQDGGGSPATTEETTTSPTTRATTDSDSESAPESRSKSSSTGSPMEESVYADGLSSHIEVDKEGNVYRCTICEAEYASADRGTAKQCCQFETKDDVLAFVQHLIDEAENPSTLYGKFGAIVGHAEDQNVDVEFSEMRALVTADEEATVEDAEDAGSATEDDEAEPEDDGQVEDDADDEDELDAETFHEAVAGVDDATLEEEGLTRDEAKFLGLILDAMNDDVPGYDLLKSMTKLRDGFEEIDTGSLEERGFIESHRVCRRRYYTVTADGRKLIGKKLRAMPGRGDLGEKTPHKVGVEMLRTWFEQKGVITRAEKYYEYDPDTIIDAVAFNQNDDIAWVGEVERSSNNADSTVKDYQQLQSVDASAVWVFKNKTEAIEILNVLIERDCIDLELTTTITKSFPKMQEAVENMDDDGMSRILRFSDLNEELD